jgi:hypothetical protein
VSLAPLAHSIGERFHPLVSKVLADSAPSAGDLSAQLCDLAIERIDRRNRDGIAPSLERVEVLSLPFGCEAIACHRLYVRPKPTCRRDGGTDQTYHGH